MVEEQIPESRTYRHTKCGNETTVGEQSFELVSNPMSSMEQTQCSSCNAMFPISEYEWSARHTKNATDRQRFLCSKKFMIGIILVSAIVTAGVISVLVADNNMLARIISLFGGLMIGAMIGMAIFVSAFANPIKRKVCGVSDTRMLT